MAREAKQHHTNQDTEQQAHQQGAGTASHGMRTTGGGYADRERSLDSTREQAGPGMALRDSSTEPDRLDSHFTLMQRMVSDMDRLLDQFGLGRAAFGPSLGLLSRAGSPTTRFDRGLFGSSEQALWNPQLEIFQRGGKLVVRADLPGVNKDDVHVDVEDGVLTIRGERREEREENEEGFFRSERSYGQFYRAVPLPDGVEGDKCDARYDNGVLEITMPVPKQEQRKSRRIKIR